MECEIDAASAKSSYIEIPRALRKNIENKTFFSHCLAEHLILKGAALIYWPEKTLLEDI